jgi:hypothetical protein
MNLPRRHSRAFATITALALMTFVGIALASLTLSFAADARRSSTEAEQAQLRQLIFAGSMQARIAGTQQNVSLSLPAALREDQASVLVHTNSGGEIEAHLGKRQMQQSAR